MFGGVINNFLRRVGSVAPQNGCHLYASMIDDCLYLFIGIT